MAAAAPNPIKVFYSYVSQDKTMQEQLEAHLSSLKREGKITTWHDGLIEPGMATDQIRSNRLKTADLILLLISSQFMYSDKHWEKEVAQALKRHEAGEARVIPIILRPTDWKRTFIGELKPLPEDGKPITEWRDRDAAFMDVAEGIRRVVETLLAQKEAEKKRNTKKIPEVPSPPLPNYSPKYVPKKRLPQWVVLLLLIVVIVASSVTYILVRAHTANTPAIVFGNAGAIGKANPQATATAIARATASAINATPNTNSTPIPFSSVDATFYTNPKDSGVVDFKTASQGVFSQSFPNIAFNPSPDIQHCKLPTTVNVNTRPFTDVVQNTDGFCNTIQVRDSRGNQAGVGNLNSFEAKFVAVIHLPSAGRLTTNVSADDGWIFCMDNKNLNASKPTPDPHNIMTNPPASHLCPGLDIPEMADNNVPFSPTSFTITVYIPAAGSYAIEIDYTECCSKQLTLIVSPSFMQTKGE